MSRNHISTCMQILPIRFHCSPSGKFTFPLFLSRFSLLHHVHSSCSVHLPLKHVFFCSISLSSLQLYLPLTVFTPVSGTHNLLCAFNATTNLTVQQPKSAAAGGGYEDKQAAGGGTGGTPNISRLPGFHWVCQSPAPSVKRL